MKDAGKLTEKRRREALAVARRHIAEISDEEDAKLVAAAEADPDNPPWTEEQFARARFGRPPLPAEKRKQRVNMYIDRDVVDRLKEDGRGWQTRANAILRKAVLGG